MNGYNETEQYIVGVEVKTNKVWIDSQGNKKTVYRKIIELNNLPWSANTWSPIPNSDVDVPNIERIVNFDIMSLYNGLSSNVLTTVQNGYINLYSAGAPLTLSGYIVEYIKIV